MKNTSVLNLLEEIAKVNESEGAETLTQERISELCKKYDVSTTEFTDLVVEILSAGEIKSFSNNEDALGNVAGGKMNFKKGAATLLAALNVAGPLAGSVLAQTPNNPKTRITKTASRRPNTTEPRRPNKTTTKPEKNTRSFTALAMDKYNSAVNYTANLFGISKTVAECVVAGSGVAAVAGGTYGMFELGQKLLSSGTPQKPTTPDETSGNSEDTYPTNFHDALEKLPNQIKLTDTNPPKANANVISQFLTKHRDIDSLIFITAEDSKTANPPDVTFDFFGDESALANLQTNIPTLPTCAATPHLVCKPTQAITLLENLKKLETTAFVTNDLSNVLKSALLKLDPRCTLRARFICLASSHSAFTQPTPTSTAPQAAKPVPSPDGNAPLQDNASPTQALPQHPMHTNTVEEGPKGAAPRKVEDDKQDEQPNASGEAAKDKDAVKGDQTGKTPPVSPATYDGGADDKDKNDAPAPASQEQPVQAQPDKEEPNDADPRKVEDDNQANQPGASGEAAEDKDDVTGDQNHDNPPISPATKAGGADAEGKDDAPAPEEQEQPVHAQPVDKEPQGADPKNVEDDKKEGQAAARGEAANDNHAAASGQQ